MTILEYIFIQSNIVISNYSTSLENNYFIKKCFILKYTYNILWGINTIHMEDCVSFALLNYLENITEAKKIKTNVSDRFF